MSHRPTVYGTRHAVSAGHYLAASAAFSILEAGGDGVAGAIDGRAMAHGAAPAKVAEACGKAARASSQASSAGPNAFRLL